MIENLKFGLVSSKIKQNQRPTTRPKWDCDQFYNAPPRKFYPNPKSQNSFQNPKILCSQLLTRPKKGLPPV